MRMKTGLLSEDKVAQKSADISKNGIIDTSGHTLREYLLTPLEDGDMDGYILKEGRTEYMLVIPETAGTLIQKAASEFNTFFHEATGRDLRIVTEADSSDKCISIGETSLLTETDITYDYSELGSDGYKIVTRDDDIYLIGGSDYGSLYAVYELLAQLVEYDFFAEDCYTVAQNVKNIQFKDFNITDIRDFA